MSKQTIGLVGLAVMGENLALNIEEKGFPIAVHNRTPAKVDEFLAHNPGKKLVGAHTPKELADALERPRRIILMVKAGKPVDDTVATLLPYLDKGDIIVDGGNSWFLDTERRAKELGEQGFNFFGMGVSGGEEGARNGPSLMPGGNREAFSHLEPIAKKIAAQVGGEGGGPCVEYLGPGGSGHYVKMVHNGIEYADMQLIAEAYDLLARLGGLGNQELADVFDEWNASELESFLIEITAKIFRAKDADGSAIVDHILDTAGQKGTGKWTSQNAFDLGVAIPSINAAVEARILSSMKKERTTASQVLPAPPSAPLLSGDAKKQLIRDVRQALYAAKVCAYAQGMKLLQVASNEYKYGLPLGQIARIWRGGCIIRAGFLGKIKTAFDRDANLTNLLVDPGFRGEIAERVDGWRRVVTTGVAQGVPCLAMSTSLGYYDMYRNTRLPANLIQAQRDFFGAHTYERTDKPGVFHTDWATGKTETASGSGH